jgi:hyperosmotically inducible protein
MRSQNNIRTLAASSLLALAISALMAGASPAFAADETAPVAHSDGVGAALHDTEITAKVKAKYASDDNLHASKIKVTTTNGVVTLTGTAGPASRKAAAEIARGVEGVKSVDNQLTSSANPPKSERAAAATKKAVTDSWITTKVKSTILADSLAKGFDVSVETHHGVVLLKGRLANHDAIDHVRDLARNIEGVKSVDTTGLTTSR